MSYIDTYGLIKTVFVTDIMVFTSKYHNWEYRVMPAHLAFLRLWTGKVWVFSPR